MQKRVLIFASGSGSNFEAIVEYFDSGGNVPGARNAGVKFELLVDKEGAGAIERAKRLGVKWHHVKFADTYEFLAARRGEYDLYVLAGYMRILPESVLALGTFINIHPSLLPKFGGKGMYGINVHKAVIESGEDFSGATVHKVGTEYDTGEIVLQKAVPVMKGDTAETLAARVLEAEHDLVVHTLSAILA